MTVLINSRIAGVLGLWLLTGTGSASAIDAPSSVVKLTVATKSGATQFGSGVVVAHGRIVTACHVLRDADSVEVSQGTNRWVANEWIGSAFHDICLVQAQIDSVPIATVRASRTLQQWDRVTAIGFQDGRDTLTAKHGFVAAMYSFDGGWVVRTSAQFDFGSSGGGLFDESGNLVGVLAFKARAGDSLRFALPLEWLADDNEVAPAMSPIRQELSVHAFWERSSDDRPTFLGVALREAANRAAE
jgi:S1-C subfamily serine protease